MRKAGVLLLAGTLLLSLTACKVEVREEVTQEDSTVAPEDIEKIIYVRYTDEKYKQYFEYCEKAFEKANKSVDVRLSYEQENSKYLQNIIDGSYSASTTMDVYMLSDSNIGTAYLAGVAARNPYGDFSRDNYCDTALYACSYGDYLIGYPLSYDTTVLVYREDFLNKGNINTFDNIKAFAENADYSSEELSMIESIFRCDLNGLFVNYGFVGNGFDICGKIGTDNKVINLANDNTLRYVQDYLTIIEYFNISKEEKYNDILDKFISGKYLSTIISTKDINLLKECEYDYALAEFPDYNNSDETSPLAITQCLVVNQNSDNLDVASDFARFATYEAAGILYDQAGAFSARRISYSEDRINNIYDSYEKASNKNKLQYGEQIYPLIEIALHNIVAEDAVSDTSGTGEADETEFTNFIMNEFKKVEEYMNSQLK